jgi:hypothetical protein
MEILCLDLILASDLNSVKHPQLWHVEEALQPVELARLERIHTEINLGQKGQVLDILHLVNFLDVVQIQI